MKQYLSSTLIFLTCSLPALAALGKNKKDSSIWEHKLEMRHLEFKGVGFNKGYSTIDYLLTRNWQKPEFLLNIRGHIFNDGKVAGNLGMGYRHPVGESYLIGGNFFYDVREIHNRTTQQFGLGFECFHNSFDIRLNGYIPFGEWSHFHRNRSLTFSGNQVLVDEKIYASLPSLQAEIGGAIHDIVYMAAGPYYLFGKHVERTEVGNACGGYFRVRIDAKQYLTLMGMITYDSIFKTTVQGTVAFNIPLGKKRKSSSPDLQRNLRHLPIYRNEIIPIERKRRSYVLGSSTDPEKLFSFVFVDNDFQGEGKGTFEAPFSSLKEAEAYSDPGNIIYVFPGNGTVQNMDEGIILKEDQILASSSVPLTLEEVTIPPLTPGQNPVITNIHPNEPVVQGSENVNLSGFEILDFYDSTGCDVESEISILEMPVETTVLMEEESTNHSMEIEEGNLIIEDDSSSDSWEQLSSSSEGESESSHEFSFEFDEMDNSFAHSDQDNHSSSESPIGETLTHVDVDFIEIDSWQLNVDWDSWDEDWIFVAPTPTPSSESSDSESSFEHVDYNFGVESGSDSFSD